MHTSPHLAFTLNPAAALFFLCLQIVHELTSHRVLVMEFIDNAVGVSDLAGLREMGIK